MAQHQLTNAQLLDVLRTANIPAEDVHTAHNDRYTHGRDCLAIRFHDSNGLNRFCQIAGNILGAKVVDQITHGMRPENKPTLFGKHMGGTIMFTDCKIIP